MVQILPQLPKGSISAGITFLNPAATIAAVQLQQAGLVTTVSVRLAACCPYTC